MERVTLKFVKAMPKDKFGNEKCMFVIQENDKFIEKYKDSKLIFTYGKSYFLTIKSKYVPLSYRDNTKGFIQYFIFIEDYDFNGTKGKYINRIYVDN